jgi:predicted RNase H-like nuclease
VLLCHAGVTPQRQLARGACVCAAWRDEARAEAHNAVMRFDGPHVARALRTRTRRRCASCTCRHWRAACLPACASGS